METLGSMCHQWARLMTGRKNVEIETETGTEVESETETVNETAATETRKEETERGTGIKTGETATGIVIETETGEWCDICYILVFRD